MSKLVDGVVALLITAVAVACVVGIALVIQRRKRAKTMCSTSDGRFCTPSDFIAVCGEEAVAAEPDAAHAASLETSCAIMCDRFYALQPNHCSYVPCWDQYNRPGYTHCDK